MTNYPIHPACALWPRPSDEEVAVLAHSIKAEGLLNPIWLFENKILDGKLRYEACGIAGVEPRFETYTYDHPEALLQLLPRTAVSALHLAIGELSLIVSELCKLPQGRRENQEKSLAKLFSVNGEKNGRGTGCKEAGIGKSNVLAAKTVLRRGEPNVIEMVRSGDVGVQTAAYFVRSASRDLQRGATPNQIRESRTSPSQRRKEERRAMLMLPTWT